MSGHGRVNLAPDPTAQPEETRIDVWAVLHEEGRAVSVERGQLIRRHSHIALLTLGVLPNAYCLLYRPNCCAKHTPTVSAQASRDSPRESTPSEVRFESLLQ